MVNCMADEILRADPRLRRQTLLALGIGVILGGIVLIVFQRWLAGISALPGNDLLITRLWRMIGIALTGSAICLGLLAWYAMHKAARIRTARQWPHPGTRVLRDTPIRREEAALRISRVLTVLGMALLLFCLGLGFVSWRILDAYG